jgi:ribose transport system permease protein
MKEGAMRGFLRRLLSEYGMIVVLLLLCLVLSVLTLAPQTPEGDAAIQALAGSLLQRTPRPERVLIATRASHPGKAFANSLAERLRTGGVKVVEIAHDQPAAHAILDRTVKEGAHLDAIASSGNLPGWEVIADIGHDYPSLGQVPVVTPPPYLWPNFLKSSNLANIASQIAVIAIIAIGMTFVIITGGIDLSVGSLIALSAVSATWLIREIAGGTSASHGAAVLCCAAGIALCAAVGLFSGSMVTFFRVPPFIVTLAVMQMARGLAAIISKDQTISSVPAGFEWFGRGADLLGIPNSVVLMVVLYAAAHIVMTRMTLGRYIYAVGGNREAARLSGVPVLGVLLLVYTLSGALAGLGGIVIASQLRSGMPTYGQMYELYVIAAVVVGGTSLSGGEGKVLGTLIGALIIAVIQNGMNLLNMPSRKQLVVLGAVILVAVLIDSIKKHGLPRRGEI